MTEWCMSHTGQSTEIQKKKNSVAGFSMYDKARLQGTREKDTCHTIDNGVHWRQFEPPKAPEDESEMPRRP